MTSAAPAEARARRRDVTGTPPHPVTAEDHALGRTADRPGRIPLAGWWSVLRRVWREASSDHLPMVAASCAFYALLALFPALSVLISLYGLALDPSGVESQLAVVAGVLPATTYQMIAQRVHDLASTGQTRLGWRLAFSLMFDACAHFLAGARASCPHFPIRPRFRAGIVNH